MSYTPDEPFDPAGFADRWWQFNRAMSNFEDHLLCGGKGWDFVETLTDSYDASVEIKGVTPKGYALTDEQQAFLSAAGFVQCWVCYRDGGEKFYSFSHLPKTPKETAE